MRCYHAIVLLVSLAVTVFFPACRACTLYDDPTDGGPNAGDDGSPVRAWADADLPAGDETCSPACSLGQICWEERCFAACLDETDCRASDTCCDNGCVSLQNELHHCNRCGNSCVPEGDKCSNGRCQCAFNENRDPCDPPFHCCGSSGCVDVLVDEHHCGGCYETCPGDCIEGRCYNCDEDRYERDSTGDTCPTAIHLGEIADNNRSETVRGNLSPDGDEDCFRFRALDGTPFEEEGVCSRDSNPELIGDRFHVDIRFISNPLDLYALRVYRGDCTRPVGLGDGATSFSWGTSHRYFDEQTQEWVGQCPCEGYPPVNEHSPDCIDDTTTFVVCVTLAPGRENRCENYEITISNGRYSTPVPEN